ncbi:methyltransferase family protein [Planctomycetota bacterium]
MSKGSEHSESKLRLQGSGLRVVIGTFVAPLIQGVLLFVAAGHVNLFRGWLCLAIGLVSMFGGILVVSIFNPALVNERGRWSKKVDTKWWDKWLVPVYAIIAFYVVPLVMGLDVGRYNWSQPELAIGWAFLGGVMFIAGSVIIHWAMIVNRHFETTVRIQEDREHKVIMAGPYKFVRHPGYVGAILWGISAPLIVGSVWAMIPTVIAIALLVFRTWLEDRTLHGELDGYTDYAHRVRCRLVPWLW